MKVAIVDDLQADKEILKEYINRYAAEKSLCIEIECFCSGEHFLRNTAPNKYRLIFLDIYMKGLDGMQVAEALRRDDKESLLVFTTSSKDFAIQGYAVKASGYLVKPYDYEMFRQAMEVIRPMLEKDLRFIEVKEKRSHVKILLHDILYCDYDNHYILFHMEDEIIRSYMKFKELEELLAPYDEFLCCYRNIMVNLDRVQVLESESFIMENGEQIPIRRPDRIKVRELYAEFVFRKMKGGSRLG